MGDGTVRRGSVQQVVGEARLLDRLLLRLVLGRVHDDKRVLRRARDAAKPADISARAAARALGALPTSDAADRHHHMVLWRAVNALSLRECRRADARVRGSRAGCGAGRRVVGVVGVLHAVERDRLDEVGEGIVRIGRDEVLVHAVGCCNRHADGHGGREPEGERRRREPLLDRQHALAEPVVLVDPRLHLGPVIEDLRALARRTSVAVLISVVLVRLVLAAARLAVRREVRVDLPRGAVGTNDDGRDRSRGAQAVWRAAQAELQWRRGWPLRGRSWGARASCGARTAPPRRCAIAYSLWPPAIVVDITAQSPLSMPQCCSSSFCGKRSFICLQSPKG
eukprot:7391800-Prymnesium_polylepis.2